MTWSEVAESVCESWFLVDGDDVVCLVGQWLVGWQSSGYGLAAEVAGPWVAGLAQLEQIGPGSAGAWVVWHGHRLDDCGRGAVGCRSGHSAQVHRASLCTAPSAGCLQLLRGGGPRPLEPARQREVWIWRSPGLMGPGLTGWRDSSPSVARMRHGLGSCQTLRLARCRSAAIAPRIASSLGTTIHVSNGLPSGSHSSMNRSLHWA